MIEFYYAPRACSTASHIALEEAGAPFSAHAISLSDPGAREAYRLINPAGTVPALSVDGLTLTENIAIITYAAARWPAAGLLPEEANQRARAISRMSWFGSTVHINRRMSKLPQRFTSDPAGYAAVKHNGAEAFWRNLQQIDDLYAASAWLGGEKFSAPDGYAFVFYHWGVLDELPMDKLVNYGAMVRRLIERPAARRALQRENNILLTT